MGRWAALGLLLIGSGRTPELEFDYRDDHDGRILASVTARLDGRLLEISIRPWGPRVEAPSGFEGFRGENVRASREIGKLLAQGKLAVATTDEVASRVELRRGTFRLRVEEAGRIVEREVGGLVREFVYRAELRPAGEFRTVFRVAGIPRLELRGWIGAEGGRLAGFRALAAHESLVSPGQDQEPVEELVRRLSDDSPDVRRAAERKLQGKGPAVLPLLERRLADPDVELRGRVRLLIDAIHRDDAVRQLVGPGAERRAEQLAALGKAVGRDVFEYLKERRDGRFVPALTDVVLYELDQDLRAKAEGALQAIGGPKVFPALLWAIRDRQVHAEDKLQWLAEYGDATLFGELERLEKAGSGAAKVARQQLEKRLPGARPEPPKEWAPIDEAALLRAAREGKTPAERIRGLRAIVTGMSQDPAALEILRRALADPEEEVRYRAAEAFTHVYDQAADPALDRMLRDGAQPLRARQMSAVALGRHGAGAALLGAFDGATVELRATIAGAFGDTGNAALLPDLRKRQAQETDPEVKAALARSVERLAARNR